MDQRAEERVAIAKDALAWIKAEVLMPECGVYVSPIEPDKLKKLYANDFSDTKQLRDVELGKCEVCAKGALFLAKAVRYNNVLADDWANADIACHDGGSMLEHFDQDQLCLIEAVFECWWSLAGPDGVIFYQKYPNPKKRLVAILKNIIKNDGTFIP